MRQIEKTYKKGVLRKLFIKICRLLGYELIDQADMSFITSLNKENASIVGKKSITLPLGEIKIKRKIRSLDIILKTCTGVNLVSQNKKRIFEYKKSEYTFRTINSLLKSLKKSKQNINNIDFKITIIDAGSSKEDKETMREILEKSKLKFNFIELNLSDYLERIKVIKKDNPQIENKTNQNQINKTCKLPSGQTVEDGFSGKDSGNNYCNYCDCSNGEYRCTEMFCNLDKADE